MPQYLKENRSLKVQTEYINSVSGPIPPSMGMLPGSSEMLDIPDSVKRPKPKDLFASATARTVLYEKRECIVPTYDDRDLGYVTQRNWAYPYLEFKDPGLSPNFDPLMSIILKKIKDQKVNVSVMIPELGKTTDMFFNLARSVYEGYKRLRRGQFIQGAIWDRRRTRDRQSKWLSQKWLEYSYGWKPVMSDIYGLSQELQKPHLGNFKKVRARRNDGMVANVLLDNASQVTASSEIEMLMVARFRESATLKSSSALGLTNPLATAWELVPYSFVLDWVIGVGEYLNNLDALVGVEECIVRSGYKHTLTMTGTTHRHGYPDSVGANGLSKSTRVIKQRSSAAAPYFPLPALDGRFTPNRAANALALLRTLKFK